MNTLNDLFKKNEKWAEKINKDDPNFFTELAKQQKPEYLWIGCSDSRVPASTIVDKMPGELFVHRNIANLVVHTDLNCLSVIQYAVEVLKVKHIILCGHYGCGGVKAAIDDTEHGLIDNWLRNIKNIYQSHKVEIDSIQNEKEKLDLLCEINVIEQVRNICHTTIVQHAWQLDEKLTVYGLIYSLESGLLKDLNVSVSGSDEIPRIVRSK
ncbi:MAG: carbonate dehydratase [bacterium]|nr:carbonate dehydratase [bacterium]